MCLYHKYISASASLSCRNEAYIKDVRNVSHPAVAAALRNTSTAASPFCDDFVSRAALVALLHACSTLGKLQVLDLVQSPIAIADIGCLCDAILSCSDTLSTLGIDVWKDLDTSTQPASPYAAPVRQQVLDAVSKLMKLRRLHIWDWEKLVCDDCEGGQVLAGLRHLEAVNVASHRKVESCKEPPGPRFYEGLPFVFFEEDE